MYVKPTEPELLHILVTLRAMLVTVSVLVLVVVVGGGVHLFQQGIASIMKTRTTIYTARQRTPTPKSNII